jgi:hypothetical protein
MLKTFVLIFDECALSLSPRRPRETQARVQPRDGHGSHAEQL